MPALGRGKALLFPRSRQAQGLLGIGFSVVPQTTAGGLRALVEVLSSSRSLAGMFLLFAIQ